MTRNMAHLAREGVTTSQVKTGMKIKLIFNSANIQTSDVKINIEFIVIHYSLFVDTSLFNTVPDLGNQ